MINLRAVLASLLLVAGSFLGAPAHAQAPANPNASANVRAILGYIQSLNARSTHRLLSGQWAGYGPAATMSDLQSIYNQTGQWPAYIGVSYTDYTDNGISPAVPNQLASAYWNAGGLVEVDCHFATSPNGGPLSDPTVNLLACITPGTAQNAAWLKMLDQVAAGLQQLQQAGVVVMWRPLHEMNGNWFWWGNKPVSDFQQFWQYLFNYFTYTKGLNNLIWIYSPFTGSNTAAYYPGAGYVDVAGFAAYGNAVDPTDFSGSSALIALGKPFGFAEFGPYGTASPPGNYDYSQFLAGAEANFPAAVFFMAWSGNWSPAGNLNAAAVFQNPYLITRDGLATDLFANTTKLSNLSVLGAAGGSGHSQLIMGFSVSGTGTDPILGRAIGPTLASFGVSGVLPNPQLQLFSSTVQTASNAGWGGSPGLQAAFASVGAFPLPIGSADAALTASLAAGTYSLIVSGTGSSSGLALGELYDTNSSTAAGGAQLVNLSTLAPAGIGGNPLTIGFTLSGSAPKRILVRAIGPSLAQFGVPGLLPNPTLALFQGSSLMASNSGWDNDPNLATAFTEVGAFALNSSGLDAALETTLGPGSYTVQVTGTSAGSSGLALAEVYELP